MPLSIAEKIGKSEQHVLRKQRIRSMNFPDFYLGVARLQKSKIINAKQICRNGLIFAKKLVAEAAWPLQLGLRMHRHPAGSVGGLPGNAWVRRADTYLVFWLIRFGMGPF